VEVAIGLEKLGVLHQVDAGLDGVDHRFPGSAVGRRESVEVVGLVHGGVQFGDRVGGSRRVGTYGASPRGHDLDVVGAFVDEPAHRPADFLLAIGRLVAHMEVAACAGDGPAGDQHPRTGDEATAKALLQREADTVTGAVFTDRRDACQQVAAKVQCSREDHHLVGFREHLDVGPAVASQTQMRVSVDESRCQIRIVAQVDAPRRGERILFDLGRGTDGVNAAVLDPHGVVGLRSSSGAVHQVAGVHDEAATCLIHPGVSFFRSTWPR